MPKKLPSIHDIMNHIDEERTRIDDPDADVSLMEGIIEELTSRIQTVESEMDESEMEGDIDDAEDGDEADDSDEYQGEEEEV